MGFIMFSWSELAFVLELLVDLFYSFVEICRTCIQEFLFFAFKLLIMVSFEIVKVHLLIVVLTERCINLIVLRGVIVEFILAVNALVFVNFIVVLFRLLAALIWRLIDVICSIFSSTSLLFRLLSRFFLFAFQFLPQFRFAFLILQKNFVLVF